MAGILYGVGVGPGDPERMTLKAVRLIRECRVIAAPGAVAEERVYRGVEEIPDDAGYYPLIIAKELGRDA